MLNLFGMVLMDRKFQNRLTICKMFTVYFSLKDRDNFVDSKYLISKFKLPGSPASTPINFVIIFFNTPYRLQ